MQSSVKIKPQEKGETWSRANTFVHFKLCNKARHMSCCQFLSNINSINTHLSAQHRWQSRIVCLNVLLGFAFVLNKNLNSILWECGRKLLFYGAGFTFCPVSGYLPVIDPYLSGVPNGAARQNTRSTGQNSAGWEIEHWPHALAGKST